VGKSANGERLKQIYAPVREELKDVESLLQAEMQSPYEAVAGVLRHGVQLGGKRLRPAIHLLIAKALGRVTPANVVIGTVVEMVHTATLIHDDVLDGAVTRRHVATINATWNNHTSILLGDYLFAQSFRLAATLDDTRTCKWVGEASRRVCEGELRQVLGRDDIGLDEETYFQIIRGKTAELCTVACSLAAAEAGCDEDVIESLAGYGENLGIAFQIADDFLDLWGDDSTVGKTLGTDLEQGKLTLPLIRLLETYRAADRQEILKILRGPAEDRWQRLRLPLQRSDAKQYTAKMAKQFKDQALLSLRPLPESPAKDSLRQIAEFSVERGF
jgi:octaprenyl-diphosphate synthase